MKEIIPTTMYRVLVVEDNLGDMDLVREYLSINKDFTYEIIHAEELSSALKLIANGNIDVILLDLGLPKSSGIETFEAVYSNCNKIPIIVLSGTNDQSISMECVKRGAQDYLIKGDFHKTLLSRSICYAIERKNLENTLNQINETLEFQVLEI